MQRCDALKRLVSGSQPDRSGAQPRGQWQASMWRGAIDLDLHVHAFYQRELVAEALVARTAQAHQVLADPRAVIGLGIEDIKDSTFGGDLQGFLLRDRLAGYAGASVGGHGYVPQFGIAGDRGRELHTQALREYGLATGSLDRRLRLIRLHE